MKLIRIFFTFLLFLWASGFFYFTHTVQHYVLDNKTQTEAVLVYGSTKQKLYVATELLKSGYAPIILITGEGSKSTYKNYLKERSVQEYQFIFDPRPTNLKINYALDTLHLLRRYDIDSIRLVTSAAEMPRVTYKLSHYLPEDITVVLHPISLKRKSYNFIFIEYNRYLLVMLSLILGLQNELGLPYS